MENNYIEPPDTIAHYIIHITPQTNYEQPARPKTEPESPQKDRLEKIKIDNRIKTIELSSKGKMPVDLNGVLPPPPNPYFHNRKEEPEVVVTEMPEFPGGEEALLKFVKNNFNYPFECVEMGIKGKILVQFIIEKDGSVSSPKIIKGIDCPQANEAALRLVEIMPRWKPGMQQGRPVRVIFNLPIRIDLIR